MATDVGIVNLALNMIGESSIMSFDDASKAARLANAHYTTLRDSLLRGYHWSFAIDRAELASAGTPTWGFTHKFPFPVDCIKILQVGEYYPGPDLSDYRQADNSLYRIEGRDILYNAAGPLKIRYMKSITDPNLFDAAFVTAFAAYIAMKFAIPLADSTSKKQEAEADFKMAISAALRANAIEVAPVPIADDTWVISRL